MFRAGVLALLFAAAAAQAAAVDLTHASLIAPDAASPREKKALTMLLEETASRSRIRWKPEPGGKPPIRITRQAALPPEGFHLRITASAVSIEASDERGILFGVGRLLREMRMSRDRISAPELDVTSAPKYAIRGHQLGYRPKTNSYDGWTVPMWEQYIRDLAVFGTNTVELIPPRSDDDPDSPHFPLPPLEMMVEMSRLLDEYGLDVSIWFPAMDPDYSNPEVVRRAVTEWEQIFRALPRIDSVFVPGGDPGHTQPKHLLALLEKQTEALHRYHPKAKMWVSPQSFNAAWMAEFLTILDQQQPQWLSGVVYGPQTAMRLADLRARVPRRYPIRNYPDITHSRQCEYPVPDWDMAYAVTEGREVINPRPVDHANIFRRMQPGTIGFVTYSEGCNDDVNKIVWSALGWDPDASLENILREYARYFISPDFEDAFAQGLLALERNWRGPLAANLGVDTTLMQFQDMERRATPRMTAAWRFQQALYRGYYDAYVRRRLLRETEAEQTAMDALRGARGAGAMAAMERAERALDQTLTGHPAEEWRTRIFALAEALFQSIRMQLSVEKYKAISVDRGATLDTLDAPLNNRGWLEQRFTEIRKLNGEADRLAALDRIVRWTDPGPGGFYDDLGNPAAQPHLLRGPGYQEDPRFYESALTGFGPRAPARVSWWKHAETLQDTPLRMRYTGLDPEAQYRIRVVYAGDSPQTKIRLLANGVEVHPFLAKPRPIEPLEFEIPRSAVRSGELVLQWNREPGLGGNGRGCQVSEVWLIRQ